MEYNEQLTGDKVENWLHKFMFGTSQQTVVGNSILENIYIYIYIYTQSSVLDHQPCGVIPPEV